MGKILFTGFNDFALRRATDREVDEGVSTVDVEIEGYGVLPFVKVPNPSRKLVELIEANKSEIERILGAEIITEILPVDGSKTVKLFRKLLKKHNPDLTVSFGQGAFKNPELQEQMPLSATGHTGFVIEPQFVNRVETLTKKPRIVKIDPNAEKDNMVSNRNLAELLVAKLDATSILANEAYVNWDNKTGAGPNECNAMGYILGQDGYFIHLPYFCDEDTRAKFWEGTKGLVGRLIKNYGMTQNDMPLMTTERAYEILIPILKAMLEIRESVIANTQ